MSMKRRELTNAGQEPAQTGGVPARGSAALRGQPTDESSDVVDGARLLRILEQHRVEGVGLGDTARLPRITRMPPGIEVLEERAGVAVGQWVLRVRCQCGRGWFELEAVEAATCPRCGLLVYLDVEAPIRRT